MAKKVPKQKVSVIPNFVDTEFIRPLPRENDFSREQGLSDKFVVSYAGSLGYVYDLDTLLDAALLLREQRDIFFLIVGNGVAKTELKEGCEAEADQCALPAVSAARKPALDEGLLGRASLFISKRCGQRFVFIQDLRNHGERPAAPGGGRTRQRSRACRGELRLRSLHQPRRCGAPRRIHCDSV